MAGNESYMRLALASGLVTMLGLFSIVGDAGRPDSGRGNAGQGLSFDEVPIRTYDEFAYVEIVHAQLMREQATLEMANQFAESSDNDFASSAQVMAAAYDSTLIGKSILSSLAAPARLSPAHQEALQGYDSVLSGLVVIHSCLARGALPECEPGIDLVNRGTANWIQADEMIGRREDAATPLLHAPNEFGMLKPALASPAPMPVTPPVSPATISAPSSSQPTGPPPCERGDSRWLRGFNCGPAWQTDAAICEGYNRGIIRNLEQEDTIRLLVEMQNRKLTAEELDDIRRLQESSDRFLFEANRVGC